MYKMIITYPDEVTLEAALAFFREKEIVQYIAIERGNKLDIIPEDSDPRFFQNNLLITKEHFIQEIEKRMAF